MVPTPTPIPSPTSPFAPVIEVINQAPALSSGFWTVLGAVVTALAGGTFLLVNEWRRRKGDRLVRQTELERKTCVEFLALCSKMSWFNIEKDEDKAAGYVGLAQGMVSELQLHTTQKVSRAADEVLDALLWWMLVVQYKSSKNATHDSALEEASEEEANDWSNYKRALFRNAVRSRFKLEPYPIPPPFPPKPKGFFASSVKPSAPATPPSPAAAPQSPT